MKTYKDFTQIKNIIKNQSAQRIREFKKRLANWDAFINSWEYRELLTVKQRTKTNSEQKKLALEKFTKNENKNKIAKFEKCDQIAAAKFPSFIIISVDWVDNRTWGKNPNAKVNTNEGVFYGSASGCGYDKLSAATAQAFNKSLSILKLIYTKYEQELRKNKSVSIREAVGYGAGYITPYFEGGVGFSCHDSIFKNCGALTHSWREGKMWDSMEYTFKECNK